MKKTLLLIFLTFISASCTMFTKGKGQVIFHWQRENTGVEKFSRDHSECMREAEDFKLIPNVKSWFYSEEKRIDIRADWHSEKGIWASYVPYWGAQPLVVNSVRDDTNSSPRKYRICMEKRGYTQRTNDIPSVTNIFIYKPQDVNQDVPFESLTHR
ncbi:MAG: hypothetical protein J5895_01310 [Alphaproteobacteria bacterium]|nr:hypothetical protein [Alphaproteobacteria bacterium]MBQ7660350.1 hypothetical protein [Alphaproteobacteria bacterium]